MGGSDDDTLALTRLYESTNGAGWKSKKRWLNGKPCDRKNWEGVRCDRKKRVRNLRLSELGLTGTVPSQLGLLASLEDLEIDDELTMSGTLPSELGLLTQLEQLEMDGTLLSGMIRHCGAFLSWP